jgi:hypothetical protein
VGIIALPIDPRTGLRAGPACMSDSVRVEFFLPGTEPVGECQSIFP